MEELELNSVNKEGQNLLHGAVVSHQFDIGKNLIERGIDLKCQDNNGQTVLHYAALYKTLKIAELIIDNGGDVNICDNYGNNALWTATFNARGDYSIVELYLVSGGGDATHKNHYGKSPLDFALQIGDKALIDILKN